MFDFIQSNRQFVVVALGLVTLGLVSGSMLQSIGQSSKMNDNDIARVDGQGIPVAELQRAARGQDLSDEKRQALVQQLVQQHVFIKEADSRNIRISDQAVRDEILNVPQFQVNGQFNQTRYLDVLSENHFTPVDFEAQQRESLKGRYLIGSIQSSSIASKTVIDHQADLLSTPRDVSSSVLSAKQFVDQATIGDDEVNKYYGDHHGDFQQGEQVKVDYVVLTEDAAPAALAAPISDATAQAYFESHKAQLAPEQRRVRHILIKAGADASAADRSHAQQKAAQLLAEVKAHPEQFADIAKKNSDDAVSAEQGGDLGYFENNGKMVKPFSDAAFKLNKGEISGVVQSNFGYHILQVEDIRHASFDEVKPGIIAELQKQQADDLQTQTAKAQSQIDKVFAPVAEKFSDTAFQQPNDLKPVSEAFKLPLQHSGWITRDHASDALLDNPKIREAAFSDDVLNKHHNSESIEASKGHMVVMHVTDHQAAMTLPLDRVKPEIIARLKLEKAGKLAQAEGEKILAALQKGETPKLDWQPAQTVSYIDTGNLDKPTLAAIFVIPGAKLPAFTGMAGNGSYTIYKIVTASHPLEPSRRIALGNSLDKMQGMEENAAYEATVRPEHKVDVRQ